MVFLYGVALLLLVITNTPSASPNQLIAAGKYKLASDELVRMIREAHISGQTDENTAALNSNLGLVYEKLGRYVDAEATLTKAIQVYRVWICPAAPIMAVL